ncbi:MAG: hypothetical protein ABSF69_07395 [Polyangiaceae bacterium]|jgi:hypothetical protein
MVRRLLVGLVLGSLVGALLAVGLVAGLKVAVFADGAGGAVLAYFAAALAGVLTGLVAGKPIWASGAGIEAGLKAFFGALLGAGAMFALRRWATAWALDLSTFGAGGPDSAGHLPAVSLPLIGAVLGALFELDNTSGAEDTATKKPQPPRKRVAAQSASDRAKPGATEPDEVAPGRDAEIVTGRSKR